MKPEENENKDDVGDNVVLVAGDIIGDTAYSQRFVLKILLKLANLNTLQDEILEKNFEDELCTLWDMTTERDVVLFLQKHDFLNLINFALPIINSPRIIEILIGLVGNMCCQKEVVTVIMKMEDFLTVLLNYFDSDDSLILIQLLRLINSCLFLSDDNDLSIWINMFISNGFSSILYFILKNSSNKDLLVTAIENLNTISAYCNTVKTRSDFYSHFIKVEAVESLSVAFKEITVDQSDKCKKNEIEKVMLFSLQILLNIIGFDKSSEIYKNTREEVITIIGIVLCYYDNKFVDEKEIDEDLIDIIDSIVTITNSLKISEICDPAKYFYQTYGMWKALSQITKSDRNSTENFEEDDKEELQDFTDKMRGPLCKLLCIYVAECPEQYLLKVLDHISTNYDDIVNSLEDKDLFNAISKRTENYRTRLKDNVDS